jgi:hypothetical protein
MAYIGNSPANIGNYAVVDDIASSFNGTTTSFALTSLSQAINPAKSGQLLVSINGVLQEPDDTGADGFKVSGSNIVFSSAPASGSTFWCVYQGQTVDVGVPSDGTIGTAKMSYPLDNFSSTGIDDNATSTAITIDSSENVKVNTGNLVIGTSGKGIDFSSTSDGSGTMTSEVLDDYEEGTWTPTIGSGTIVVNSATYTKVGRVVTLIMYIHTFSDNTGASAISINGLPFTSASAGYSHGTLKFAYVAAKNNICCYVSQGSSAMAFHEFDSNQDYFGILHSAIKNNSYATRAFAAITYMAT